MTRNKLFSLFVIFSCASFSVKAGESPFGFIYTTDLLPQGKWEFEQRINTQHGQANGSFNSALFRSEIEYGVTDDFQTALYLNYDYVKAKNNDTSGKTTAEAIPPSHNPDKSYSDWQYRSTAVELIYRVMSPYKDAFGLALYFEPYYGKNIREYEGRIILQKNFLDDTLILSSNIVAEYEKERFSTVYGSQPEDEDSAAAWSKMLKFDVFAGASYRFVKNWFGGFEYRLHNDFDGHRLVSKNRTQLAHFAGPTIHYGGQKHFWTLATMFQIKGKGLNADERMNIKNNKIYGDHTNLEMRLTYGYFF